MFWAWQCVSAVHSAKAPSPCRPINLFLPRVYFCRVFIDTRQKSLPSARWLTLGKELFVVKMYVVCSLSSVTLGKAFAECFVGFAECLWHTAKPRFPVVNFGMHTRSSVASNVHFISSPKKVWFCLKKSTILFQPVRLLVNDRKFPAGNSVFLSHQTSQQ